MKQKCDCKDRRFCFEGEEPPDCGYNQAGPAHEAVCANSDGRERAVAEARAAARRSEHWFWPERSGLLLPSLGAAAS